MQQRNPFICQVQQIPSIPLRAAACQTSGHKGSTHRTSLPETLGAGLQAKPPLDWSVSPKSYVSLGLGLYSRLGRDEASLILEKQQKR